jgi:indolepyruvate ferredoxin oxidoreductase, alpha subunit
VKPMGEMLLRKPAFSEIVMGNTSLVRAMVEAGTRVVSAYPGSPTPEIATAINSIPLDDRPFCFEFSTNEKVAMEVAFGAAINGHLSTVFFKSVGLNVAADTFVQLNLINIIGGMVIVLGDDPGANSSQNEQDNRHYSYLSYTAMLEPANPAEVYQYYLKAAELSKKLQKPVILRMTTHVCHMKEKVAYSSWKPREVDNTPKFSPENGDYIPLVSRVSPMKQTALANLPKIEAWSDDEGLNETTDNGNKKQGIIVSGLPYLTLLDVLESCKTKPDILKLGLIYPPPKNAIRDFLKKHEEVKILEELDNELEKEIKMMAFDEGIETKIIGKNGIEDWIGEYTPDKTREILNRTWPEMVSPKPLSEKTKPCVPARPAQMCPGCGHRSAFHAVKKALATTDITVADIGCHTLGFQEPYYMGQVLMCMGASSGIASGMSLFNDSRKVVAFLGDSTFFHAGLPGIINALFNKHNFTLILMENGTTAMTGHQDHAGSGRNFNSATDKIPVKSVLEGLGIKNIVDIGAYKQADILEAVKTAVNNKGFNVIIARHPCMLKFTRKQRKSPGYRQLSVEIDQGQCDRINECIETFACPSFTRKNDGSIEVNKDLCIGDGSCKQTCPVSAIEAAEI